MKKLDEYKSIISYLDSSLCIKPINQKLVRHILGKVVTRVINYKRQNIVLFPPFIEFGKFIGEITINKNDPGLIFDTPKETGRVQQNKTKINLFL